MFAATFRTVFAQTTESLSILRVGNGSTALTTSAAPVFIDQYTINGDLIKSIPLPTTVKGLNKRLTLSGNTPGISSLEGGLSISQDGRKLVLFGYDAAPGLANVSTTSSATVKRVVGIIDGNGNINTTNALDIYNGVRVGSAVVNDTSIWLTGGSANIYHAIVRDTNPPVFRGGNVKSLAAKSGANIRIFNGQVYVSQISDSALSVITALGTGLPASPPQTLTSLPGMSIVGPISNGDRTGREFFFAKVGGKDVLYAANTGTNRGIGKYSFVGGNWVYNGSITGVGYLGLTGKVSGDTVQLYAITFGSGSSRFVSIMDNTGYNSGKNGNNEYLFSQLPVIDLVTSPTNTAFRGIVFSPRESQDSYLVEAEDFQFLDRWIVSNEAGVSGSYAIRVDGSSKTANAYTALKARESGTYQVWTRAIDYADATQGTRRFRVHVNGDSTFRESGQHGRQGYYWEKVGTATLSTDTTLLRIQKDNTYGRCDAILLTSDPLFNPNSTALSYLSRFNASADKLQLLIDPVPGPTYTNYESHGSTIAQEISNGKIRLRFYNTPGGTKFLSSIQLNVNGVWRSVSPGYEDNRVYLLRESEKTINFNSFYPAWDNLSGLSSFRWKGKSYSFLDFNKAKNPFYAGELSLCNAISVVKDNNQTLRVTYTTDDGKIVEGVWKILPGNSHVALSLSHKATQTRYYSFVVSAFHPIDSAKMAEVQLPPMYQYQRVPQQQTLIPSAMSPQPVSIVETKVDTATSFSYFVTVNPETFPTNDWGRPETSPMGLSLKNEKNLIQPIAFSPVLGLDSSRVLYNTILHKEFVLGAVENKWNNALEYLSEKVYEVRDYRQQDNTSLTDAALNIIDLLGDTTAANNAGWNVRMKGFYDIEQNPVPAPTVAQAGPLSLLSAAVLSRDESFYKNRALPAIEYTLSRKSNRSSNMLGTKATPTLKSLELRPDSTEYNVAYFEGLHKLLNEANPWLIPLALPNGNLRGPSQFWSERMAAYRLTDSIKYLTQAINGVNSFINSTVYGIKTQPVDHKAFYNAGFYANWWDLVDMYEHTQDAKYLNAAEISAFHTLAGLRNYPIVRPIADTIHQGNIYSGVTHVWWKDTSRFRLGILPPTGTSIPVVQKTVPQSLVSPVGLGIEQPSTFFVPNNTVSHIYASTWAPSLLRIFQYTNREIFQTYARNSIIGRYTNHPGYYGKGFTDLMLNPEYPLRGPDVTSIYYHHIPFQFALTLDYLVTEAMSRSKDSIKFPWSRQEGFVFFNNRIFGSGKGKIYDDNGVKLILKRGLVSLNTPAVNYITGVSNNRFWVVLSSQKEDSLPVNVTLGSGTGVASNVTYKKFTTLNPAGETATLNGRIAQVTLGPKATTALSFSLSSPGTDQPTPPLENGMYVFDLPDSLGVGKFYVFRIRSPFGWDSIFGYLGTAPDNDLRASLRINSGTSKSIISYPYEWSFYDIPYGEDAVLTLNINRGGVTIYSTSKTIYGAD